MPRHSVVLKTPIEEYLAILAREERAAITIKGYRQTLLSAMNALDAAQFKTNPRKIGEEQVNYLRHKAWAHLDPMTCRRQISTLSAYLEWYGNPVIKKMRLPWPQEGRINVDWLEANQAMHLLYSTEGVERMVMHLELGLGLRRCEVIRLRVQDMMDSVVNIHGKGRYGGKWRTVPWRPDTQKELRIWLKQREQMIKDALEVQPNQKVPETLVIYARWGWKLGGCQRTAIDSIVKRAAECANIPPEDCSNHTLRRTCGRMLYRSGVEIATISKILGHEDSKTTIKYLGLNLDDMQSAWGKLDTYMQKQEQTAYIQTK